MNYKDDKTRQRPHRFLFVYFSQPELPSFIKDAFSFCSNLQYLLLFLSSYLFLSTVPIQFTPIQYASLWERLLCPISLREEALLSRLELLLIVRQFPNCKNESIFRFLPVKRINPWGSPDKRPAARYSVRLIYHTIHLKSIKSLN